MSLPAGYDDWKTRAPEDEPGYYEEPEPEVLSECPHCDQDPCTGLNIIISTYYDHVVGVVEDTFQMPDCRTFKRSKVCYVQSGKIYKCLTCDLEDHMGDEEWDKHRCPGPPTIKPTSSVAELNDDDDIPF